MRLRDKIACITGSASGMGAAAAILFAREGARVVAADINLNGVGDTVTHIRASGGEATALQVDVCQEESVADMIQKTVDTYGGIDILYNNAGTGISGPYKMASVVETPLRDYDGFMNVLMRSVFMGCKYAIPIMARNGGGAIINTASIAGLVGMLGFDAYSAAKGGVISLTRALAVAWAAKGIRVNCICPGLIETPMIAPALQQPEGREAFTKPCPMGRLGQPNEVASLALFLASDESSFITGTVIPVDGGWTAQ